MVKGVENMAYTNFIPELWAEKVQRENEKMLVMAKLCNREWEGELKKKGDTVHILGDWITNDW